MFYLITGEPGSKKTAVALNMILTDSRFANRPVFLFNLRGPKTENFPSNWSVISKDDVLEWFKFPPGSVIFIDEGQDIFRPKKWDTDKPEYYTAAEKHRHDGIDVIITTQHPMFIDTHIRRLVKYHRHLMNPYGLKFYGYEFSNCKDNPEKFSDKRRRVASKVPASVFDLYESTVLDTNQRVIPKQLYYLLGLILFIILGFIYIATKFSPSETDESVSSSVATTVIDDVASRFNSFAPAASSQSTAPLSLDDYVAQFRPRIPSVPWSAPAYDHLTQPTVAPVPLCAAFEIRGRESKGCRCWTQQHTQLDIAHSDCMSIVNRGLWNPAPVSQAQYSGSGHLESYRM